VQVVEAYPDPATSGGSLLLQPKMQALLDESNATAEQAAAGK